MSDSRAPEVRDLGQVTFHVEGPLGIVTLNRPQVLNAQGCELPAQAGQASGLAQAGQGIRVVIVRGAGGVFSAGHDLSPGSRMRPVGEAHDHGGNALSTRLPMVLCRVNR
jgi:enoyl-CoA hydratase/carnithine racemase